MSAEKATDALIEALRAEEWRAHNTFRGEIDAMIYEARLKYQRFRDLLTRWTLVRRKEMDHVPNQVDQFWDQSFDDWSRVVRGASKLCQKDLYSRQHARLKRYVNYGY
jgi:hypothetical protein